MPGERAVRGPHSGQQLIAAPATGVGDEPKPSALLGLDPEVWSGEEARGQGRRRSRRPREERPGRPQPHPAARAPRAPPSGRQGAPRRAAPGPAASARRVRPGPRGQRAAGSAPGPRRRGWRRARRALPMGRARGPGAPGAGEWGRGRAERGRCGQGRGAAGAGEGLRAAAGRGCRGGRCGTVNRGLGGYGGLPRRCAGTRGPDPGHRCARGGQCAWPAGWRARETRRAGECGRRGGRGGQLEGTAGACAGEVAGGHPRRAHLPWLPRPETGSAARPPPLRSGGAASFWKSQPGPRASAPRRTLVSGSMKWAQLACRVLVKRGGEEDVVSEAGMGLRK